MEKKRLNPPSDFLRVASSASLQSFELARLNRAANLRREIAALIDQWIEETSKRCWRAGCWSITMAPFPQSVPRSTFSMPSRNRPPTRYPMQAKCFHRPHPDS